MNAKLVSNKQGLEVARMAQAMGLRRDDFQDALTNGNVIRFLKSCRKVHDIFVDYSIPLETAIAEGNYDHCDPMITNEVFVPDGSGFHGLSQANLRPQLFQSAPEMTTQRMLDELASEILRPASFRELLAYGAQCPGIQRESYIVAIDQVEIDGVVYVPALYGDHITRCVRLYEADRGWDSRDKFLAFPIVDPTLTVIEKD